VHVWGGISFRGHTGICIFEGIMDGDMYVDILKRTLIPFITEVLPDGHRFVQDNDPKQKSKRATDYIKENNINWYHTLQSHQI